MKIQLLYLLLFGLCISLLCCNRNKSVRSNNIYEYSDNKKDSLKIILGEQLFFDKRLSQHNSISCAHCHRPELAFTDGLKSAVGIEGRINPRNTPTLYNVIFSPTLMFDAHVPSLEMQTIVPIQEHNEMGILMKDLLKKLRAIPEYQNAAKIIFDRDFDAFVLTRSLAAFERTLVSNNSRFDQYYYKNKTVLSDLEIKGWKLFSEKLNCTQCHSLPHFTDYSAQNNGLYVDYGEDQGRFRVTKDSSDLGKFKTPTLRNIILTKPYMHDGSLESLDQVLDHYEKGGAGHINQSELISPVKLSQNERIALITFFATLTDTSRNTTLRYRNK